MSGPGPTPERDRATPPAGVAFGLAAVTGACRLPMRRSQRLTARPPSGEPGSRGGGLRRAGTGVRGGRPRGGGDTPVG